MKFSFGIWRIVVFFHGLDVFRLSGGDLFLSTSNLRLGGRNLFLSVSNLRLGGSNLILGSRNLAFGVLDLRLGGRPGVEGPSFPSMIMGALSI